MIFPKLLVCLCVLMGSAFADDVDEMINVALHEKMEAVKAEMVKPFCTALVGIVCLIPPFFITMKGQKI